ncbi:hypothetical protein S716_004793 [Salmonella enterica subsp. enterica]|nr:hypothetical protein [Salmonella enterica subsp. enterica serovar Abony]
MDIYEFSPTGGNHVLRPHKTIPDIRYYLFIRLRAEHSPQPTHLKYFMLKAVISKSFRKKYRCSSRLFGATSEITWYRSKLGDRLTEQDGKTGGAE